MNLFTIGACVSTVCFIALFVICCIFPKWSNNMVNFVSAHQILFGTFQLVCICIRNMGSNIVFDWIDLEYYFLLLSVCWSFCGAFFDYWKLVEVKTRLSSEKRIATAFSYGMFLFVILFNAVIPSIIEINEIKKYPEILRLVPVVMMLTINCIICTCIYISVIKYWFTPTYNRSYNESYRALVGIALNCDVIAFIYFVAVFGYLFNLRDFIWMYDIYLFATVIYCCRIAFLTIHVLTSKFSMELYKSLRDFDRQERGPENVNNMN